MAPPECGEVRGRGGPPTAPRIDADAGVIELSFGTDQTAPWIVLYPHRVAANATDTSLGPSSLCGFTKSPTASRARQQCAVFMCEPVLMSKKSFDKLNKQQQTPSCRRQGGRRLTSRAKPM